MYRLLLGASQPCGSRCTEHLHPVQSECRNIRISQRAQVYSLQGVYTKGEESIRRVATPLERNISCLGIPRTFMGGKSLQHMRSPQIEHINDRSESLTSSIHACKQTADSQNGHVGRIFHPNYLVDLLLVSRRH